jgi:hypothetical protein
MGVLRRLLLMMGAGLIKRAIACLPWIPELFRLPGRCIVEQLDRGRRQELRHW